MPGKREIEENISEVREKERNAMEDAIALCQDAMESGHLDHDCTAAEIDAFERVIEFAGEQMERAFKI